MSRTLLIDGDIAAYQVAASIEVPIHWGDGLWTLHSDATLGCAKVDDQLHQLKEDLKADRLIIALTDQETNWRLDVLPTYKGNRKEVRKPLCLPAMREHLLLEYETFLRPRLEGDDVLGILQTAKKLVEGEKVIVSIDKDMKTIPGKVFNLNHARKALEDGTIGSLDEAIFEVTEGQADFWHMYQTLTGDTTDGYKGCPGVGPKKAVEILTGKKATLEELLEEGVPEIDVAEVWPRIVEAYRKAKLFEGEAVIQAQVARILRVTDYDFKAKQPIPWTPPV